MRTTIETDRHFLPRHQYLSQRRGNREWAYKVIKLSDVQNGEVLIDQLASYEITNNAKIESYLVQEGDVIISVRGAGIKIAVIPPHEGIY
ncbi:hypothetical protein LR69_04074 [Geobacillus sp. BCO2]|nr:hypothetical protein LR69_04074 [Geobacillus sp. BCO2]